MSRILALDIGSRNIGLAITDDEQIIAQALDFTASPQDIIVKINDLKQDYELESILIGLPKTMAGQEGTQAEITREIAKDISEKCNLPVIYFDERLTTKQSRGVENIAGLPIDSLAAQKLLEQYLIKLKNQNEKDQPNERI